MIQVQIRSNPTNHGRIPDITGLYCGSSWLTLHIAVGSANIAFFSPTLGNMRERNMSISVLTLLIDTCAIYHTKQHTVHVISISSIPCGLLPFCHLGESSIRLFTSDEARLARVAHLIHNANQ